MMNAHDAARLGRRSERAGGRRRGRVLLAGALAALAPAAALRAGTGLADGEAKLSLAAVDPGPNLVPNPSFEQAANGVPEGWLWDPRNTDAALALDAQEPHTGKAALKLASGTAFGAHVYGTLWLARPVPVKPATRYTLSAFVKSGAVAPGVWIGGGEGWTVRRALPATRGQWKRVTHTFETGGQEKTFVLRVCVDRPTDGVWLDDLALREGDRPVPGALEGAARVDTVELRPAAPPPARRGAEEVDTRWAPERWPEETWAFCAGAFRAEGAVTVADASRPAEVEVVLTGRDGRERARRRATLAAGSPAALLTFHAELGAAPPDALVLTARLLQDGRERAACAGEWNLVTPARVRAKLGPVAQVREYLREGVEKLERAGLGAAPRVTLTVADNFLPWVEDDLKNGQTDRAWDTVCLLEQMAAREAAHVQNILSGQAEGCLAPRYATGPLEVKGGQTLGSRRYPDGRTERGPVILTGYGHFGQVRRDVERLQGYGCNLLQVEFGPRSVLTGETNVSDRVIADFLALCDRAASAHVAVNLLLSPHYFPEWALEKWPHLKACHGGFFRYCVHDPDARAVLEKSLRAVIPRVKDHPALHSVCLSNEPVCEDLRGCRVAARAWPAWLAARYGTVEALNRRWGTAHADFAAAPLPAPAFEATPACLDFVRFNQETFAAFHRWMADVVRELAPDLPVHAKIMMGAHFRRTTHGFWSVAPELFAGFSQYNGNDAYNLLDRDGPLWANGWRHCQMGYDFQRSMADLPVFNSENHLIRDRDHGAVPPGHLYAGLWQQAVHGQTATTLWVWERTNDPVSDFAGSLLHRPDAVEAVGRCALDLNRLAREVAALQNLEPAVVLLWSLSSAVLGEGHEQALAQAYEAANFLGLPLGFATERKLAEAARGGPLPRPFGAARVLLLPQVTHLPDDARAGLDALRAAGVRVVAVGAPPARDDANQERPAGAWETLPAADGAEALFARLCDRAAAWRLPQELQLTDAAGRPAFGVEIRSAPYGDGRVASICNHRREPRQVRLTGAGGAAHTDLISGRAVGASFTAEPLMPLLLVVK